MNKNGYKELHWTDLFCRSWLVSASQRRNINRGNANRYILLLRYCILVLVKFCFSLFFHQKVWSIEFLKWSFRLAVRPLELHIQQFKENASHLQHKNKIDSINSLLQINRQTRVFQPSVTIHNDFRELRTSCLAIEFCCFCHLQECYE